MTQGLLFQNRPHGASRVTDPETSKEAGRAMSGPKLTEIKLAVMQFFRDFGPGTDSDLELALGVKYPGFSTLRKRRGELVQAGLLRDTGKTKPNGAGHNMKVWSIS